MTRGHDPAALFNKTRSKVKLDTLDKLTREMRRLRNLAHKTGAAITNGESKIHVARIIINIDVTTAVARRAYILLHYQLDGESEHKPQGQKHLLTHRKPPDIVLCTSENK